jgi:hypothetical protein
VQPVEVLAVAAILAYVSMWGVLVGRSGNPNYMLFKLSGWLTIIKVYLVALYASRLITTWAQRTLLVVLIAAIWRWSIVPGLVRTGGCLWAFSAQDPARFPPALTEPMRLEVGVAPLRDLTWVQGLAPWRGATLVEFHRRRNLTVRGTTR